MRIGINSPVVVQLPGSFSPWEADAGIAELGAIAEAADTLGFDFLTCSEHVMVPADIATQRGGTYWDPLATFGYLAARTSRIRLATQVLVLGYHHPLAIAKRYGTLDLVSGGRLVLGLGVGSLEEEFALLGARFEGRGAAADDALRALRAALSTRAPSYDGPHFSFSDVVVSPHAVQPHVPFWIGGRTPRSLRRAVELADGWVPFGLAPAELAAMLARADVPEGFEVVLTPDIALDPSSAPDAAAAALGVLEEVGATAASVRITADSAGHYVEQLHALAELRR
ncbi:TIGR03619 family F420-dependent LLM class oxidoreductase [Nocardioides sp. SLBN-35]|uniref:TIGR03619 family F420-dependent LLM class oxidoreductase n=1 Tax=Nocardioides sp. SLBN-35 TaxID=2768445 RepID=UPI001154035C|nr:TIGR03619 family F420-dependent LLM class oxidoreductase [Nocardioides sp. SLBN-35]TQK69144.1 putative F420-dependent oxidoreductase [Nocardioides sp. SLBN-35]